MPTYEYECQECDHKFEAFQSITDAPLEKCPKCEGKVRKLISAGGGLIFKGSGFYITDYKRKEEKATKEEKGKEEPSKGKEEKKEPTKKEGKKEE